MGPRISLDAVEKRKILYCPEFNPGRLARSPSLYRPSYPDSQLLVKWYFGPYLSRTNHTKLKWNFIFFLQTKKKARLTILVSHRYRPVAFLNFYLRQFSIKCVFSTLAETVRCDYVISFVV
jgi:hypothetical protein